MAAGETFFGMLRRLSRDTRGNTLVLVAALTMPMAGLVGGGIDMSRLYLVKTRLQQACDAGALTGRKTMAAGTWVANSNAANAAATKMFDANFKGGAYGSGTMSRSFAESGGTVTGTASVPMPMTLMKIFGITSRTIAVTCDAEMKIPNTDVMFVLDNTGSMGDTNSGDTDNKITGLKKAVKCFYEALQKVNTTADCGSTPSGATQNAQIRFGFVPYSVNVNVGKLLPNSYFADTWNYQTRVAQYTTQNVQTGTTTGTPTLYSTNQVATTGTLTSSTTYTNIANSTACNNLVPADGITWSGSEYGNYNPSNWTSGGNTIYQWTVRQNGTLHDYSASYAGTTGPNAKKCTITDSYVNGYEERTYRRTDTPVYTPQPVFSGWSYQQAPQDVSGLKAGGSSWNNSVSLPIGSNGANTSVTWDGCIEERPTVRNTDGDPSGEFSPIPASAYDLNIDLVPTSGTPSSLWGPALPGAVWGRTSGGNNSFSPVVINSDLSRNYNYYCPTEAKLLAEYPTATNFETYVDSLFPTGNTYHDIGLLWGARFLSPTGMFAATNNNIPNIQRHLIFMTDGDTNTDNEDYNAYGVPWWDRRETNLASAPSNSLLDAEVDARFPALCTAIKNMNITLWVISYGTAASTDTNARLSACASSGKYFLATNTATLISNFQQIADKIADLRLTN